MYIKFLLSIKTLISFWMKECILITHICNLKIIKALRGTSYGFHTKYKSKHVSQQRKSGGREREKERNLRQTTKPRATVSIN